ncbi:hypothetical protein Tco_0899610 [Tanacetum coccineum]
MDYVHTTEAELGIDLDIPLSKQDPLDKLNDLVNKKRRHADDIHDYFKANKRLKSSVQYEDYLPGTVLNEHVLVTEVSSALALQILRRLGSIFTLVYEADHRLKKAYVKSFSSAWIAFVRELESMVGVTITAKTVVFLKEMMDKKGSREWQLNDLGKEAKERAREIEMEISEDLRLAREINALCARVTAIVDEGENFVDELDILAGRREFELRAQEKGIFIEKLKGNLDF